MNDEIEKLLDLGRMDFEAGYPEYARAYFEKVLALDPNNREATEALAEIDEILSGKARLGPTKPQVEPTEQEARPPEQRFEGPPGLDTAVAKPTKKRRRWWLWGLVVVLGLLGCSMITCLGITVFLPSQKETPTPLAAIPEKVEPLPTVTEEAAMGESVIHDDVKTTVIEYELTDSFLTSYGAERKPAEGAKFLWLRVRSENVGEVAHDIPGPSPFVLLYKDTRISRRSAFWGRQGYTMYEKEKVYPSIAREGWILYEIPVGADPAEILVRFEATGGLFTEQYHIWSLR